MMQITLIPNKKGNAVKATVKHLGKEVKLGVISLGVSPNTHRLFIRDMEILRDQLQSTLNEGPAVAIENTKLVFSSVTVPKVSTATTTNEFDEYVALVSKVPVPKITAKRMYNLLPFSYRDAPTMTLQQCQLYPEYFTPMKVYSGVYAVYHLGQSGMRYATPHGWRVVSQKMLATSIDKIINAQLDVLGNPDDAMIEIVKDTVSYMSHLVNNNVLYDRYTGELGLLEAPSITWKEFYLGGLYPGTKIFTNARLNAEKVIRFRYRKIDRSVGFTADTIQERLTRFISVVLNDLSPILPELNDPDEIAKYRTSCLTMMELACK